MSGTLASQPLQPNTTSSSPTASSSTQQGQPQRDPSQGGHTVNGKTEKLLTGDVEAKVRAAALAKVQGTVERVETNVDSSAPYEAHIVKSDGTEVEVQVNSDYTVAAVNAMRHALSADPRAAHGPTLVTDASRRGRLGASPTADPGDELLHGDAVATTVIGGRWADARGAPSGPLPRRISRCGAVTAPCGAPRPSSSCAGLERPKASASCEPSRAVGCMHPCATCRDGRMSLCMSRRGWRVPILLGLVVGALCCRSDPAGAVPHPHATARHRRTVGVTPRWHSALVPGQGVTGFIADDHPLRPGLQGPIPRATRTTGFTPKNESFAGIIHGTPTGGGANLSLYCIDINTHTYGRIGYGLGTWDAADCPQCGLRGPAAQQVLPQHRRTRRR